MDDIRPTIDVFLWLYSLTADESIKNEIWDNIVLAVKETLENSFFKKQGHSSK